MRKMHALCALASSLVLGAGCADNSEYFGKVSPPEGQVFRLNNGSEPEYLDPQKMTGQPDGRIAWAMFEGLTRYDPKTLVPMPGVAESWDLSPDGKVYTFHLRKGLRWSNGDPFTAQDFVYSWRRFLTPETAAQYAYLLFGIHNAEVYNSMQLLTTLRMEGWQPQALNLRRELDEDENFTGRWIASWSTQAPGATGITAGSLQVEKDGQAKGELKGWILGPGGPVEGTLSLEGRLALDAEAGKVSGELAVGGGPQAATAQLEGRRAVAEDIGIRAVDDLTFEVSLDYPIQYFLSLCAFYPLSPVPRQSIEKNGDKWTELENLVSNGAFVMVERKIQDRMVLIRNERYWNAKNVRLEKVILYPIELYTTGCDLYKAGELDVEPSNYIPQEFISSLSTKKDYRTASQLGVYFYRLNVTNPVLKDKRVRKALSMAVDRDRLVKFLKAGQPAAYQYTPPGIYGYDAPKLLKYDPEEGKRLLADAGYPEGKGFPTLDILYNTTEQHRQIAEIIQRDWKNNLGIDVRLNNQEWKVYLKSQRSLDYQVSRSAWIADYADPTTFLDMWLTGGGNNNTGWSSPVYDRLIGEAAREIDPVHRMQIFRDAETLLLDELPIIPIYSYTTFYLQKPYVRGYYPTSLDAHPLEAVWIDHDWQSHPQE